VNLPGLKPAAQRKESLRRVKDFLLGRSQNSKIFPGGVQRKENKERDGISESGKVHWIYVDF
jgi:hypothetical protein